MRLDPVHWPPRVQGIALPLIFVTYVLSSIIGSRGGPLVMGWFVIAMALIGALRWRYRAMPWRDIASWTIPMVAWMSVLVVTRLPPILALGGLMINGAWLGLFACWSPLVPRWYRSVLRKSYVGPRIVSAT